MKTVAFYSYKGGVGRTLVVANVARYLAQFGLKVVALDLDLEAPGLHHKFALEGSDVSPANGIVDYITYVLREGSPPPKMEAYTVAVPPPAGGPIPITLIPAGDAPSPHYWESLSQIDWHALLYTDAAPGVALFEDLKARIESELAPDYLLIDARTGMTEMGGIATSLLADVVVTLSLTTREHLEGVRSVLRSVNKTRRANGDDPIQLEVALSRLPDSAAESVVRASRRALEYLNAAAEDKSDSLSLDEVLVLHTEPSLQEQERLLIGSESKTAAEPALLADYLRLFTRFIPIPSLAPRVKELVQEAMNKLLEDPLSTERSLEVLARYTGHPDALRALIKLYRVRQDNEKMLAACAKLWEITGSEDLSLLWTAVREGFEVTWRYQSEDLPLNFVKSAWIATGQDDVQVGLRLAQTLDNFGREEEAVQVAEALFANHVDEEVVAEAVVRHRISAERYLDAAQFASEHADDFAYDIDYLTLWAQAVARLGDRELAASFLEDSRADLEELRDHAAGTLVKMLRVAGRETEGVEINRALDEAVASRDYSELFALAEEYALRGIAAKRHFESTVRRGIPESADDFLADVRRSVREWRSPRMVTR